MYSLNDVEDKPATETELGVWSMYDQILKSGKENNLKEWQKSDQFTKSIEQVASHKGVNINTAVTEENIKKFSGDVVVLGSFTGKILDINGIGQEEMFFVVQHVSEWFVSTIINRSLFLHKIKSIRVMDCGVGILLPYTHLGSQLMIL